MVRDSRGDMKGLPIDVRVSTDDGQYERVVNYDYMNVVGVLGDSVGVSDGERDEIESIVPYKSRWDI